MRWEFANVAVVVLTLACADSATEPMAEHTYFVAASVSKQDEARTEIERSFLDIESRSPGFAGYYFEGETLVTMSASPTSDINALFEEAKGALARNGRSDMAAITSVSHRHRNVGYSFRQLAFWREAAGERILDLSGTISLDVDEIRNRLVVGYISTADRGELQEVLDQAHVPTSAVLVVTEEPVVRTQRTLDSRVRPLTSGN